MRRKAMRSRASMWWCGCARPAEAAPLRGAILLDLLVWIDAPQARLLDPAVEAFADETAPPVLAALHHGEHAVLKLRVYRARGFRLVVQRQQLVLTLGLR